MEKLDQITLEFERKKQMGEYILRTHEEENLEYLKGFLGTEMVGNYIKLRNDGTLAKHNVLPTIWVQEARKVEECLDLMEKYGNDRWWASDDKPKMAYYQFKHIDCMLIPYNSMAEGLRNLLGREVLKWEIKFCHKELKEKVEAAFNHS